MREISNSIRWPNGGKNSLESQPCVRAVKKAKLSPQLKKEVNSFIKRNVLSDCGRVPPNCLKAHIVKTAIKLNLPERKIRSLKKLFRSRIGYNGYYLDAGKLKKV